MLLVDLWFAKCTSSALGSVLETHAALVVTVRIFMIASGACAIFLQLNVSERTSVVEVRGQG